MKRLLSLLCLLLLLSSCSGADSGAKNSEETKRGNIEETKEGMGEGAKDDAVKGREENKKRIYASFFPVYDLTKRIAGDKMELSMIIDAESDPHNFELKISEMTELASCDLIIYNGANMEPFIDDLKKVMQDEKKEDPETFFLDLSQGLTLLKADESDDRTSINPHTWLSVRNAMIQLDTIYQKLSSIDPENEPYYRKNLEASLKDFEALEKKMQKELGKLGKKEKYFVTSHAAFNYLASDYGLKQVAITGISPDLEPSARELKNIADFVKKHQIKTVFFEGKATPKVAETLARETGVKTDILYTMEHLGEEEIEMGYLKLMERNLDALLRSFQE